MPHTGTVLVLYRSAQRLKIAVTPVGIGKQHAVFGPLVPRVEVDQLLVRAGRHEVSCRAHQALELVGSTIDRNTRELTEARAIVPSD